MQIRLAKETEIKDIMKIYAHARQFMTEQGNPNQWAVRNWPPEELIREDIEKALLYVCVDDEDRCHAVFFYDYGFHIEPLYDTIENGSWIGEETYGVVHRIASDGSLKGAGAFCLSWAYEKAGHIRIDTHPDNKPMQNLLKKLGFQYCGITHVEADNDPRLGFEKL